jgi:hypothetical protein
MMQILDQFRLRGIAQLLRYPGSGVGIGEFGRSADL